MRFRALGPLRVVVDGNECDIPAPRQRTVLAVLLLERNRLVPLPRLIDAIWADDPPATARSQVQICVSALRRLLLVPGGGDAIRTRSLGYELVVAPGECDLDDLDRLLTGARAAAGDGHPSAAVETVPGRARALARWRPLGRRQRAGPRRRPRPPGTAAGRHRGAHRPRVGARPARGGVAPARGARTRASPAGGPALAADGGAAPLRTLGGRPGGVRGPAPDARRPAWHRTGPAGARPAARDPRRRSRDRLAGPAGPGRRAGSDTAAAAPGDRGPHRAFRARRGRTRPRDHQPRVDGGGHRRGRRGQDRPGGLGRAARRAGLPRRPALRARTGHRPASRQARIASSAGSWAPSASSGRRCRPASTNARTCSAR